jgi:hypothetical protein
MPEPELMPCPWQLPDGPDHQLELRQEGVGWWITCGTCGAEGPTWRKDKSTWTNRADVIDEWNAHREREL